jgi:hypothetical protein
MIQFLLIFLLLILIGLAGFIGYTQIKKYEKENEIGNKERD